MTKLNIPNFKLNNGADFPVVGYGTWLGLNDKLEFDTTDVPKIVDTLEYAIDSGYRHIDTAHLYRVEPEVGEVINKKIQEGVRREDIFVTTKVWHHHHREKDVEVSVRDSLRRMKLDYIDLVLMHWPMSISQDGVDEKIDYLETWRGFESVLEKGLVKAIGVSNFNVDQMKRLIENSKVTPAVNQVEINLNLGQKDLVDYCKSQKVVVVGYSAFGTMVPSRSYPDSPEPKLNNPVLVEIAKRYNKTVTQVTLRYLYQRGVVTIPKTVSRARVIENADIFDFSLTPDEQSIISKFDNGFRTVRPVWWQETQHYPFDKVELKELPKIPLSLLVWKNGAGLNID